jgi:hypothetical protein
MAKVLRTVGMVAGVVALAATGLGAFAVAGSALAATAGTVASVASVVAAISQAGAQALAKPPAQIGQINNRIIGANNPLPYLMGRSFSGGVQVHDVGYGGEVDDVDNPYRWLVYVHSACGPVDAIETTLANFSSVSFSGGANEATGYYADYWWRRQQLGARPESSALTPQFSGAPRWGSSYKLSGFCAVGHNLKWSKRGKRFGGGQLPIIGEVIRGVRVYDPRLDSTYPGGSGSQRINNESTWAYSRNTALHALAYSYGRYVNSKKVFGVDLGGASIDLASAVAWANVCDANGWTVNGTIYEPGNKWENLKRICAPGGGVPVLTGGILRFDYQASRTSLATITRDDLAGGPVRDQLGRGWKDRHNTIVPRYRSEAHQWEFVQSAEIAVTAFVTEDGETKLDEIQYDLVTDKDQAAELATYEIYQRRELGPISVALKPHWRDYDPGECFTVAADVSPTGASLKVVMRSRSIDPGSGVVNATFEAESDAKHTAALGSTGTAPSTIAFPTGEDIDNAFAANFDSTVTLADIPPTLISANSLGVTTTALPLTRQLVLTSGGVDVSADATWSLPNVSGGITATIGVDGLLSISVANASGAITVRAVLDGVTYEKVAQVVRSVAPAPSGGGSGSTYFYDGDWDNVSSTSFVQVTDTGAIVRSDGSGEILLDAGAGYYSNTAATIKVQTSPDGSTWSDVGSTEIGTALPDPEINYIAITRTATGLTPSTDYYVRLLAKGATTDTISWLAPGFSASQP